MKHRRKVVVNVTSQTAFNLQRLAKIAKCSEGKVVDYLVRDRMLFLQRFAEKENTND